MHRRPMPMHQRIHRRILPKRLEDFLLPSSPRLSFFSKMQHNFGKCGYFGYFLTSGYLFFFNCLYPATLLVCVAILATFFSIWLFRLLFDIFFFLFHFTVDCPDPTCSDHGFCVDGSCICKKGWKGTDCGILDEEARQCLPDCSGQGIFDLESQTCQCNQGFVGDDCSSRLCSLDCGDHGR